VPVDPVLTLALVAVLANLVVMGLVLLPPLIGRRGLLDEDATDTAIEEALRTGTTQITTPDELLGGGVPRGAYDRVVRVAVWVYLATVAIVVIVSGLWPETQAAILGLIVVAAVFVLVVHDLLPASALGTGKYVVEASLGITFAALLVLLTGQGESPFFFTFPLLVAGAALVVVPPVTVALALAASGAYLLAVLLPIDAAPPGVLTGVTVIVNLAAMFLLAYIAMVIAGEQRRSRDAAIRLSTVDSLTGLFNRAFLFAAIEREIARSDRSGRGFCLLMLDLDGLKAVNDRHGHHTGDQVLRAVGAAISDGVRRIDTPARYGGDEFAVVCPETDRDGARVLAEKIRAAIAGMDLVAGEGRVPVSASFGVVAYPLDGSTADALFITADRAMYVSKRSGRNRVSTASTPIPVGGEAVAIPIDASSRGSGPGVGQGADEGLAARTGKDVAGDAGEPIAPGTPTGR
jgi:diguanylate cyclase (GGDEF)-like protein